MFGAFHCLWYAVGRGCNETELAACVANGLVMERVDVQTSALEDLRRQRIGFEIHRLCGQIALRVLRMLYQLIRKSR